MAFDMQAAFRSDLPEAPAPWTDGPPFGFVGGHNDAASVPFAGLAEAAVTALSREGRNLATYNLGGSPLGYLPLREFLSASLTTRASMPCDPDEILDAQPSLPAREREQVRRGDAHDRVPVAGPAVHIAHRHEPAAADLRHHGHPDTERFACPDEHCPCGGIRAAAR